MVGVLVRHSRGVIRHFCLALELFSALECDGERVVRVGNQIGERHTQRRVLRFGKLDRGINARNFCFQCPAWLRGVYLAGPVENEILIVDIGCK